MPRSPRRRCAKFLTAAVSLTGTAAADPPEFVGLGDVGAGDVSSLASAVSADGAVVTGRCTPAGSQRVFRWTGPGGMVSLGGPNFGIGVGSSADGAVLVCNGGSIQGDSQAFRWTSATGFTPLLGLGSASPGPRVFGVTADGAMPVGESNTALASTAVRWDAGGVSTALSNEPGFDSFSARGVSGNGSIIVGGGGSAALGVVAFRWTLPGGMVALPDLAGGIVSASANGISADGSTIVGYGTSDSGKEATVWSGGAPRGLGDLEGGVYDSSALAASGNGTAIVGYATTAAGSEAFIWNIADGMHTVKSVLEKLSVTSVAEWTLTEARGVSADGTVIVGFGTNPAGMTEAWMARIPGPCYANCDGSTLTPYLTGNDFLCFLNRFVNGDPYCNCDGSSSIPILNVNDFQCFLDGFADGCT